jgi:hypothetical protein
MDDFCFSFYGVRRLVAPCIDELLNQFIPDCFKPFDERRPCRRFTLTLPSSAWRTRRLVYFIIESPQQEEGKIPFSSAPSFSALFA